MRTFVLAVLVLVAGVPAQASDEDEQDLRLIYERLQPILTETRAAAGDAAGSSPAIDLTLFATLDAIQSETLSSIKDTAVAVYIRDESRELSDECYGEGEIMNAAYLLIKNYSERLSSNIKLCDYVVESTDIKALAVLGTKTKSELESFRKLLFDYAMSISLPPVEH